MVRYDMLSHKWFAAHPDTGLEYEVQAPEYAERLFSYAREANSLFESQMRSFSGADVAEAEHYRLEARFYADVAIGLTVEEAFAKAESRWRSYAAEVNSKIEEAPRHKHGPRTGQSVTSHRYCAPEKMQSKEPHMRYMVRKAFGLV